MTLSPGSEESPAVRDPGPVLGDRSQLISSRSVRLGDGCEDGVRAIDVRSAGGLSALVLADRGLDLGPVWAAGWQVSWQSTTGIVHPSAFDEGNWLRSFPGGLLTTCGFQNVGPAVVDGGVSYGQHGRASNLPARNVRHGVVDVAGVLTVEVSGEIRETDVYGVDLVLHRRLRFPLGLRVVEISDELENRGYEPAAYQLLYHVNLGWPVVAPSSRLVAPPAEIVGRDEESNSVVEEHARFVEPTRGFPPLVYEHRLLDPERSRVSVGVANDAFAPTNGIALTVSYDPRQLPRLWRWRMLAPGMYLTAIEPATCSVFGRDVDRAAGELPSLEPGERRTSEIRIDVHLGSELEALNDGSIAPERTR